jgi:hypothetical protein
MSRRGLARLNPRRDANEREVIQTLEARGFSVAQISGKGVPDLLVGSRLPVFGSSLWLVEVKQPKGKLNAAQLQWRERWNGPAPIVVRSVEDALAFPLCGQKERDHAR